MSVLSVDRQWLQFDIGPPTLVTAVVTRGRGDGRRKHWVTRFRLSYSNDTGSDTATKSARWVFYRDASHLSVKARSLIHSLHTTRFNRHNLLFAQH